MIEEWNKWQGQHEDGDWVEGDWAWDWNEPSQAWDRYALMDGKLSKHALETTCPEEEKSTGKGEPTKDTKSKRKSKAAKNQVEDNTAVDNKQENKTEKGEGSKKGRLKRMVASQNQFPLVERVW